jgi:glycosyltransferase involved in cell wall biosynthesis
MLMGKPVIATNWSANTEFCKRGCSFPVGYKLVPVLPDEYFPSMKEWAEADVDDAAKWLRLCYDDPALRKEVGLKGKAFVEEHFSIENFKKTVEEFLERSKVKG